MVKKISSITIIILAIILTISTIYKLNQRHEEKLYTVLYEKIKYQAKQCYLKKECENTITLEELYLKKYLTTQYDPVTKEELNKYIKLIIQDEKIEIVN